MVKYLLSIEKKRGIYEEIDYSKLCNKDITRLDVVDSFTSSFNNEDDLKEELVKNSLISLSDYNKRLVIRYKSKGKLKNLSYGLAYKEDIKFMDPGFIASFLLKNKDDLNLIEKLCNHYRNSYIEGTNLMVMRSYINKIRTNATIDTVDIISYENAIKDFVIRECYSYDSSTYTYKVDENGNPLLKYKSLHDLGIFLSYSTKKKEKVASDIKIIDDKPKVKEKVYEYKQMTIFDYMKKQD